MAKETKKSEAKGVCFRSRYSGLRISYKKQTKDKDGKHIPAVDIQFVKHEYSTDDAEIIKFLTEREIAGIKQYGIDYWRQEDTEKFIHRIPKDRQQEELMKCKDDEIARLRKQLAESTQKV